MKKPVNNSKHFSLADRKIKLQLDNSSELAGWEFSKWEFSGWEMSGGNHSGGNFSGESFHVTNNSGTNKSRPRTILYNLLPHSEN